MIRCFPLSLDRLTACGGLVFYVIVFVSEIYVRRFVFARFVQCRNDSPNFNVFIGAFRRKSSGYVLCTSVKNKVVRRVELSQFSMHVLMVVFRLIIKHGFTLHPFRLRHISGANSKRGLLLKERHVVFLLERITVRSRFMTLHRRCVTIDVAKDNYVRRHQRINEFVRSSAFYYALKVFSVVIIHSASILIILRMIMTVRRDPFVFLSRVASGKDYIRM